MQESLQFYRDVLCLKVESCSADFCSFDTGHTKFAIEPGGVRKQGKKTLAENPILIQLRADSSAELEAMNQDLEAKGIELLVRSRVTPYGVITSFLDPDGNKIEIICQQ